ncbi:MAG: hypothetical protein VXY92_07885 [Planctomycetota bacterium]|nr:hypothetical protein [Planctomycetota bacterium]
MLPCNWRAGLAEVVEQGVFVTPPVDGWSYAVGRDVAVLTADPEQIEASVVALSAEFGEAYWFAADDGREVYGWARGERGHCTRAYAFAEETGPFLWFGEVTDAERQLGCFVDDPRDRSDDEVKWWPDRAVVCAVAGLWAADPSQIGGPDESSAGLVGRC